jgi:hypothetical protein
MQEILSNKLAISTRHRELLALLGLFQEPKNWVARFDTDSPASLLWQSHHSRVGKGKDDVERGQKPSTAQ